MIKVFFYIAHKFAHKTVHLVIDKVKMVIAQTLKVITHHQYQ